MWTIEYLMFVKHYLRQVAAIQLTIAFQRVSRLCQGWCRCYWKRGSLQTVQVSSRIWDVPSLVSQRSIAPCPTLVPQANGQTPTTGLTSSLNQSLLWVTQSSTPYLFRELIRWLNQCFQACQLFFFKYLPGISAEPIRLIAVEERRVLVQPIPLSPSPGQQAASVIQAANQSPSQATTPLVAYVNISQLDGQIMGKALDHLGCQFIPILSSPQSGYIIGSKFLR